MLSLLGLVVIWLGWSKLSSRKNQAPRRIAKKSDRHPIIFILYWIVIKTLYINYKEHKVELFQIVIKFTSYLDLELDNLSSI